MGFDKTFALLGGKPVIAHTIAAFEAAECVDQIILVCRRERISDLEELRQHIPSKRFRRLSLAVNIDRTRSVPDWMHSIEECRYVAVHDAARPLVTPAQIERVFAAAPRTRPPLWRRR